MKERRPSRSNARAGPGPSCDTQPGREILPPGEGTSDNAMQKAETELPVHAPHLRNRTPAESRPDLSTLRPVGSPAFTHGAGEPTRSRDPLLLPASSPVETGRCMPRPRTTAIPSRRNRLTAIRWAARRRGPHSTVSGTVQTYAPARFMAIRREFRSSDRQAPLRRSC